MRFWLDISIPYFSLLPNFQSDGQQQAVELTDPSIDRSIVQNQISCPVSPLTCENKTTIPDQCCFEYPGGIFLQSQFWNYKPRKRGMNETQLIEQLGPLDSFTVHGLWPDDCFGSYEQFCDSKLFIDDVYHLLKGFGAGEGQKLLNKLELLWKSNNGDHESLWIHEFNKHGSCIRNIRPECYERWDHDGDGSTKVNFRGQSQSLYAKKGVFDYFNITFNLFEKINTFEFLEKHDIIPSVENRYSKSQIEKALKNEFQNRDVFINCDSNNVLNEVWYYHLLNGTILNKDFIPIDSIRRLQFSKCKEEGIKFYPKGYLPSGDGDKGPSNPSKLRGIIKVDNLHENNDDDTRGFLIRDGKWMMKGTPANFEIIKSTFGNYNLKTRHGYCTVDEGKSNELTCHQKNVKYASQFDFEKDEKTGLNYIGYSGLYDWGAVSKPSGRVRKPIFLYNDKDEGTDLKMKFKLRFVET
ncbi:ribonuclease T2 NDAI_0E02140 [Naumovozyma dairenensis CBS 421]|uniref:Ribonuclease T2-like n=1 Tax=Naumovozyma dairenensis (strain ATCC 10597 / BCRC 20456 / CBS 421 / NBRC 0211 / NRRL Y-12639) TaxID=1071378 RepID=G0WBB1_NAUDC|nr:hypothetical protein NDAI_0E02140 [Naumovozyma dairenensis CBS 421]CCD25031.1 hypothetical protein NDAI_0E02140 [Naumovozyma dairenensis CBS 421]